jgi:exodeoxyribonuclease V gamma subunit
LVDRLGRALRELAGPQPVERWRDSLGAATEALAAAAPSDAWQHEQFHRVLDEVVAEARPATPSGAQTEPSGVVLDLGEVRALLADRLRGRPTRANFRTGDLTVCTLVPMRSVPHRVVCLLGLDDGVFPRHAERDGDDLIAGDPRVGDRDARSEDRQLLLDAILAATEHLVVTFSGRDERTNHQRPPAVPIAELLDTIDRTGRVADGTDRADEVDRVIPGARRARDVVTVEHPLQSFDPRNFTPGALDRDGPWSFDSLNLGGALALREHRREPAPFLPGRLPPAIGEVVQLESLVRFVEHPVRAFLRERLGVYARGDLDEVADSLPIELNALEKWGVGDRLLDAVLGGADLASAILAEQARGLLPPDELAGAALDEVVPIVEALAAAVSSLPDTGRGGDRDGAGRPGSARASAIAEELDGRPAGRPRAGDPTSVEVHLRLADGRLLIGTVPAVRADTIVRCVYSALGPKHRLAAWVRFLALSAARPDLEVSAATVGRGRTSRGRQLISVATIDCLAPEAEARVAKASRYLDALVDLYDRGMREPLPIYCATSAAWAAARRAGGDPFDATREKWDGRHEFPGESAEPEHRLVLGGAVPFDRLLRARPEPDEGGPGWDDDEAERFGRLARRVWDGPLEHEQVAER